MRTTTTTREGSQRIRPSIARHVAVTALAAAATALAGLAGPALAQQMPDIGFRSVGRGAPLADVQKHRFIGPRWLAEPGQPRSAQKLDGFRPDALPPGITPLPRDLFNSPDFYADKALWTDKRYFRCNSPAATELQRGVLFPNPLTDDTAKGPWGHCDEDYPRDSIVSPYGFTTAQLHWEALKAEAKKRGTLKDYTYANFPAIEWNGQYQRPVRGIPEQQTWYWGAHSQIPTILSVLTPEYQQRFVQEAYHQVRGHAVWPSTFCWPEGFARRFYPYAVWEHEVLATPDVVHISAGVAGNFVTKIHLGREFNLDDVPKGGVPRLGEAVPRWYGETIGFWDGDVLVTWTSNIQGWKSHSAFEWSNQMQSIEIYTPIRDKDRKFIGLNHEAILYDKEALAVPVRIVRNLHKIHGFRDADAAPIPHIECNPTIFSVKGINRPVTPNEVIEYEIPDRFGRPWDAIWRKYFEQGMSGPELDEDLFNFE